MSIYIDFTVATLTGGTTGGLVFYITKSYFTERIKQSVKHEFDNKLENIKGDITKNQTILNSILSSQNQTFQVGQNEILSSINILWTNYLLIRSSLEIISRWDNVLLEDEFDSLFTENWKGNDFVYQNLKLLSLDKIDDLNKSIELIEANRPFLNEKIWMNIIYLNTFSGRIILLYYFGVIEQNIKHWKHDNKLIEIVRESLNEEELKFIMESKMATIKAYQMFIEQKLLSEIHNIITGKIAAENTYNQALKLTELIKKQNLES